MICFEYFEHELTYLRQMGAEFAAEVSESGVAAASGTKPL